MNGTKEAALVQQVLDLLEGVRQGTNGYTALCPAHDDKRPSLSIAEGDDGRVLLHCHAGCETNDIVDALDLSIRDLFPDARKKTAVEARNGVGLTLREYADAKKLPLKFLEELGLGNVDWQGRPAVRMPYLNANGEEACARFRVSMEDDVFRWTTGDKLLLYGLWRLKKKRSKYVCVVEGESDCQTLWLHNFPAVGLPGANSWKENWAQYLEDIDRIYVVIEPDTGGEAVRRRLRNSVIRDRVRLIMLDQEKKDPSALYLSDSENFTHAWKAAMKAAIPWSKLEEQSEQRQQPAPSQANRLLRLADTAELFHASDGEPFASVLVDEHQENWPIRSRQFRQWLLRGYYLETKSAPQHQAVQEAIAVLESKANFEGSERPVFLRMAEREGKIYLDLCNDVWEAVEIMSRAGVFSRKRRSNFAGPGGCPPCRGPHAAVPSTSCVGS